MTDSHESPPTLIVVASTNPVKINSARQGFEAMYPDKAFTFQGVGVESGVSAQPFGDIETLQGATNRAENARVAYPDAAYTVGIEGGVAEIGEDLYAFAWVVILGQTRSGRAKSGAFALPREVVRLLRQGMELGHADDQVFGRTDSKRQTGSIGILTRDVITRTTFYSPAVMMALIPFLNPELDFGS